MTIWGIVPLMRVAGKLRTHTSDANTGPNLAIFTLKRGFMASYFVHLFERRVLDLRVITDPDLLRVTTDPDLL